MPLPVQAYAKIKVTDPWSYAELGEAVEAWGFRLMQHEHKFCDRAEVARERPAVVVQEFAERVLQGLSPK